MAELKTKNDVSNRQCQMEHEITVLGFLVGIRYNANSLKLDEEKVYTEGRYASFLYLVMII